jgi:hypothetical protein
MKGELSKEDMHTILVDVFGEDNIKSEYYTKYNEQRPRFKILKYSKKLGKKYTMGTVETFVIGTIFLDGTWEMIFEGLDKSKFTFKVQPGSERDYIGMIADFINEFNEIKEMVNKNYNKYCDIKHQCDLEIREWKLNKVLNGTRS